YLKGLGPGALPVFFGLGSSCDYNDLYVPGDDFLLFLQRPEAHSPTEHSTYACAGNANLTTGDTLTSIPVDDYLIDVKAATGPGLPPDHSDLPREAFWALAIILPIAFLAAATLAASRRR
ncbi:MAG: hypothetical protein ACE5FA_14455, partial [Dehalococcoidia bacterium]